VSTSDKVNESVDIKPSVNQELKPLEEGDYYLNEEGFMVFAAQFHLKRGYCCGNGCKHCPYPRGQESGARNH